MYNHLSAIIDPGIGMRFDIGRKVTNSQRTEKRASFLSLKIQARTSRVKMPIEINISVFRIYPGAGISYHPDIPAGISRSLIYFFITTSCIKKLE